MHGAGAEVLEAACDCMWKFLDKVEPQNPDKRVQVRYGREKCCDCRSLHRKRNDVLTPALVLWVFPMGGFWVAPQSLRVPQVLELCTRSVMFQSNTEADRTVPLLLRQVAACVDWLGMEALVFMKVRMSAHSS